MKTAVSKPTPPKDRQTGSAFSKTASRVNFFGRPMLENID